MLGVRDFYDLFGISLFVLSEIKYLEIIFLKKRDPIL